MPTYEGTKHEGAVAHLTLTHEAWYGSAQPDRGRECCVSMAYPDDGGGTTGEFTLREHTFSASVGGERAVRLEVFDDGWDALLTLEKAHGFMTRLAKFDGFADFDEVVKALIGIGIVDATERTNVRGGSRPAVDLASVDMGAFISGATEADIAAVLAIVGKR